MSFVCISWSSLRQQKKQQKNTIIVKLLSYHDDDDVYRINRSGTSNESTTFEKRLFNAVQQVMEAKVSGKLTLPHP